MLKQLVSMIVIAGMIAASVGWLAPRANLGAADQGARPVPAATQEPLTDTLAGGRVAIDKSPDGHFRTEARLNNARVTLLIDTGASLLALRESDARRAGLRPSRDDYRWQVDTAGGIVEAARMPVRELRIGTVRLRNVEAFILPDDALSSNLLGMNVLSQFGEVTLSADRLVLDPRG